MVERGSVLGFFFIIFIFLIFIKFERGSVFWYKGIGNLVFIYFLMLTCDCFFGFGGLKFFFFFF